MSWGLKALETEGPTSGDLGSAASGAVHCSFTCFKIHTIIQMDIGYWQNYGSFKFFQCSKMFSQFTKLETGHNGHNVMLCKKILIVINQTQGLFLFSDSFPECFQQSAFNSQSNIYFWPPWIPFTSSVPMCSCPSGQIPNNVPPVTKSHFVRGLGLYLSASSKRYIP